MRITSIGVFCVYFWPIATPMGEQQPACSSKDPVFVSLEEGEDILDATIIDEGTGTEVTEISFSGPITVGGIRCEDNNLVTELNLKEIRSITVIEQAYTSARYADKDFALIQVTWLDGLVTSDAPCKELLIPRHIVICGIEKGTRAQKACYLSKIDKLIIHHPAAPESTTADVAASSVKEEKVATDMASVEPLSTVKKEYKEMEVKVVEKKKPEVLTEKKTLIEAVNDLIGAIIGLVKALFNFVKGLFW